MTASARGSGVSFSRSVLVFTRSFADVLEKNEKKKKTTSVYRLTAASEVKIVHEAVDIGSPIECFHSRGQHLCKFIETKESVCIRKEFNSHRPTRLGHQHGRRFIVLGHQYGRRDVMIVKTLYRFFGIR